MGEIHQIIEFISKKKIKKKALIDSGADTSYIKYSLAKKLNLPEYGNVPVYGIGSTKGILSQALVRTRKEEEPVPIKLIILKNKIMDDSGEEVILGMDFLQQEDVVIDYEKDKIFITRKALKRYRI